MHHKLGYTFKDSITGFRGIAVGRIEYMSGCTQLLLVPGMDKDGKLQTSEWFDEQRCLYQPDVERVVLDNGETPGHDSQATLPRSN